MSAPGRVSGIAALLCVLIAGAVPLSAAAPDQAGATAEPRAPIVGGSLESGDPAVVAIGVRRVGCGDLLAPHCTGTLIAPRLVLTAAHCVFDVGSGIDLEVLFGSGVGSPEAALISVSRAVRHPDYLREGDAADLAVLILGEPAPVAPVPLPLSPIDDMLVGSTVRVVGYGQTEPGQPPTGDKSSGTSRISAVEDSRVRTEPGPSLSCQGDSGGPVLGEQSGQEVLLAVASRGDPGCTMYGDNVRVDRYAADFIEPWMAMSADAPFPRPAGPIAGDAVCTAPCASDADCPLGLTCQSAPGEDGAVVLRCLFPGLPPGSLDEPCHSDDACDERCVRVLPGSQADACRCFRSCSPEPRGGGCSFLWRSAYSSCVPMLISLIFLLFFGYSPSRRRRKRL